MTGLAIPCFYLDDYLPAVIRNYPHDRKVIVCEDFKITPEHMARNLAIRQLLDCEYVWTVDADEFITKQDQAKILSSVKGHDAVFIPVLNYTQDLEHVYEGTDHKPVVLVNPNKVEFYDGRCLRYTRPLVVHDCFIHHLGFTYTDEKKKFKIENYWNKGNPREYQQILNRKTIPHVIPDEIKEILKENKCLPS